MKTKRIWLMGIFMLAAVVTLFFNSASAVTLDDTIVIQVSDSENEGVYHNYTFPEAGIDFHTIRINGTWVGFNETSWNLSSTTGVNITLAFLYDDISSASEDELIIDFYAETSSGTVTFNISGLKASTEYTVKRGGVTSVITSTDEDGNYVFENSEWSEQHLEIYEGSDEGVLDITDPFPVDEATEVSRPPANLSAYITGTDVDVFFYFINMTPVSSTWTLIDSWSGITNEYVAYSDLATFGTTYEFLWGNTTYTWSVNISDGVDWLNESFTFTTVAVADGSDARYDVDNDGIVFVGDLSRTWAKRTSQVSYIGLYDVDEDDTVFVGDLSRIWANR